MTQPSHDVIALGIPGFTYHDLYDPRRLADLLDAFDRKLEATDKALFQEFQAYRSSPEGTLPPTQESELLVRTAPHVAAFIAQLFGVENEHRQQLDSIRRHFDAVFTFRHEIVEPVKKRYGEDELSTWDVEKLQADLDRLKRTAFPQLAERADPEGVIGLITANLLAMGQEIEEAEEKGVSRTRNDRIAALRDALIRDPDLASQYAHALEEEAPGTLVDALLETVRRWTYAALHEPELKRIVGDWVSFKQYRRVDFSDLVAYEEQSHGNGASLVIPEARRRYRDGFRLTDKRFSEREVLFEIDHCIYCHDRDRDSCSKGMRKKDGTIRANPLDVTLTGCPLSEKISEAHLLKRNGDNLAALAVIVTDNPMVPGTGHRICNDCMKGCIYQKVEPVNIPQIETNILTDVLFMPYGFEIYSLLTRWNPLNVKRPCALPYNGKNVLVVGLGPSGYTLSHYLLNEGFGVVGIDALKLEPPPIDLTGSADDAPAPIRDFNDLYEDLDKRIMAGFGGVAEYGITVRWDKNFLNVIHLTLDRRRNFTYYGGVRFGGTLTVDDAWDLGFDHIAIASGAGKPTLIDLKNNMIRGIRKASDFLMGLQLTGAAKHSSMANLQVRLPAGVIGGGLTAIDTTTELIAYYPVQVEKMLTRYERLVERYGEEAVRERYDEEETGILDEFLTHGRAIREERGRASSESRHPDFLRLIRAWGGVTLFYRKGLKDSPAYRQNHEEIEKALEEGIVFTPGMNPTDAIADNYGHLSAVRFERQVQRDGRWVGSGEEQITSLRSLFVAAGTSPNIIYEDEHPGTFQLDAKFFQRFEPQGGDGAPELEPMHDTTLPKLGKPAPFTSYRKDGKCITFFGDNHPVYAGNVVKAMASARDGYPYIAKLFEQELAELDPQEQSQRDAAFRSFKARLHDELIATVAEVNRLTPTIVEVVVKAPMQARKFQPGQFYRVQNLETFAPLVEGTRLTAEGLALTGAWVDKENGLISLIALEMGASSKLCGLWKPGEPLVIMGPTGAPTEIPRNKNVLLIGGGLGNAVLLSIGQAMRQAGNRVVYFAGYRKAGDVFKVDALEQASDYLVWAVDPGPDITPIPATRADDKSFVGNIVEAMMAYATGELGDTPVPLQEIDHLIVIGSDRMMAAVKEARFGILGSYLKPQHVAIGSINSPMQCMMKGVCAQCMCKHVDPVTGEERFVYSCFNQDQPLDEVDFPNLTARLRQNSVQEKLSDLWLDYLLEHYRDTRV